MHSNLYMTFDFFFQDYLLHTSFSIVVNYQRKLNCNVRKFSFCIYGKILKFYVLSFKKLGVKDLFSTSARDNGFDNKSIHVRCYMLLRDLRDV